MRYSPDVSCLTMQFRHSSKGRSVGSRDRLHLGVEGLGFGVQRRPPGDLHVDTRSSIQGAESSIMAQRTVANLVEQTAGLPYFV